MFILLLILVGGHHELMALIIEISTENTQHFENTKVKAEKRLYESSSIVEETTTTLSQLDSETDRARDDQVL